MEYRSTGFTARPERTAEMFNAYYLSKRYETSTTVDGMRYEQHPAIRSRRPSRRLYAA